MAGSTMATLGFAPEPALAEARAYKISQARMTRNTCPYCSVGCGLLMYSRGDGAGNSKEHIFHIEGDPDHPVSRGALCPKAAGLVDLVNSKYRLRYPMVREAGAKEWKRLSWREALSRIARHMKEDRDANFVEKNAQGVTVNRYTTTGMFACTSSSNETGFLTLKLARALGMVCLDHVARI
jgi:formate dehydrogenase major subunit